MADNTDGVAKDSGILQHLSEAHLQNLMQTWDWGKVKKEENDAGVWGPQ